MSLYNELLTRIWRTYLDAGNGFHTAVSQTRINTAFQTFENPLRQIADQIERQRAGLYQGRDAFVSEARDTLRVLDAQHGVLRAAVDAAAQDDSLKIRIIDDRAAAVRKAMAQQQADAEMVEQVGRVVRQAREDVRAAADR